MRIILLLLASILASASFAQGVGIGTANPNASALLDLQSNSRGFLPPRLNTTQRNGIMTPAAGLVIFNIDMNALEVFDGVSWTSLAQSTNTWGEQQQNFAIPSLASNNVLNATPAGVRGRHYGYALASNNNMVAIGNPHDVKFQTSITNFGVVEIQRYMAGDLQTTDHLSIADATSGNGFGESISMDENTMIVGAPYASSKGRAYIYSLNSVGAVGTPYTVQGYNGNNGDDFGKSVSVSGDYAIVGAPEYRHENFFKHGTAYVFVRSGLTWVHQAQLLQPDGETEDMFGYTVAINGNTAVVGAFYKNSQNGKVYVYNRTGTTWTLVQQMNPPGNPPYFARFGMAMQIVNDTLLVGADAHSGNPEAQRTGNVFVYKRINGTYTLVNTLAPTGKFYDEGFGRSLHMRGDRILIGAPFARVNGKLSQGKSYVFKKVGNTFIQEAVFATQEGNQTDLFGNAVQLTNNSAIIAAPYSDLGDKEDNGRVYYFNR